MSSSNNKTTVISLDNRLFPSIRRNYSPVWWSPWRATNLCVHRGATKTVPGSQLYGKRERIVCSEEERPGVLPGPDWQTKTKRIGQRLSRILMRSGTVQYQSHRERVVFCLRTICLQVENGKSGGFVDPAFR